MASEREPFAGRFWGVFNVEGDDPSPLFMFRSRDYAAQELARRQALPEEHDDRLDEYHQIFPCDIAGAWWNRVDPDPRADSPLDVAEIVAVHKGDARPPCPGAGWEWDAFALQWFQPGAKGKAIAVPNRARGTGGAG